MVPQTIKSGPSARRAWPAYLALGLALTAWGGFWLVVLLRSPPGRSAGLWCAALSMAGVLVTLTGLLAGAFERHAGPSPYRSPAAVAGAPLGPGLRADRPHASGARPRRPHCRFRHPD